MKTLCNRGRLGTAGKTHLCLQAQIGNHNINHFRKTPMHNPPSTRAEIAKLSAPFSGPDVSSLLARIKAAHQRCKKGSVEAINAAVECGLLLLQLRKQVKQDKPREWGSTLESINFPRKTAWNYMRLAEKWDGKALHDGIYFCNLLRDEDFGLLPELTGGGRRLGKAELERRRLADQLLFHFERVAPAFDEVLRYNGGANPLMSAPKEDVAKMERAAERVLDWAREARKGHIEV